MTVDIWQQQFSKRVIALMKENNISQRQLSKASGISPGRLNEYVSMKAMPNIFAIINIAYVFDISIESLIDFGERIE